MGIHLIITENRARCRTMLGTDSQAAIKAVQNELSTPTNYIVSSIIQSTQQIHKIRGNKNYMLTIWWTVGHIGINRNKIADEKAKKATKGQSSDSTHIPLILQ
jgi:ribonuclease HI